MAATTGKTGRELFTLDDRPQQLYQVGSMGCASAMGLGIALNTQRPVLVLDGDGAALMKLGAMATIGAHAPGNLIHVLLDNGVHDSTGRQATVSPTVDFAAVAQACGYPRAYSCDSEAGFAGALEAAVADGPRPVLIHASIAPGSLLLQQLPQQPLRRSGAASWLDQEVENFTFVVDRPPQPMSSAADPDDHFVKVPTSTGTWTAAAKVA